MRTDEQKQRHVEYVRRWKANKRATDPAWVDAKNSDLREWRKKRAEISPEFAAASKSQSLSWRKRNPERVAAYRKKYEAMPGRKLALKGHALKRNHGMTLDDWKAKLAAQGGVCVLCSGDVGNGAVDHNHSTGQIRDILCRRCNLALAHFENNPRLIVPMITYLQKWGSLSVNISIVENPQ